RLREAMRSDVIVTSGGVSVGDYDLVKDVLQDMGMDMKFWKVAMRPGQPLAFGTIGNRPTFGLPGNPVAAMISFEQFARPALRKMGGYAQLFRKTVDAAAAETIETKTGRKYFLRCRLTSGSGGYSALTTGEQGSGILRSMTEADGLMIVADDVGTVQPGDRVKVQIFDPNFGFTENPDY
ncbi:MAG: molybdopterin molybdenumtransferase MoeA, partial [Deltaproteobacteria bacterium]|nr:molybdopterin molybdenumtransferase MoeA [Deltaproteobacteria bacterium]